jgi:hypothetical protein
LKILEVNGDSPNSILEKGLLLIDIAIGFFTETKTAQKVRYDIPSNELLDVFKPRKISPGRMACTGFLNHIIRTRFGDKIELKILDFGCGDGTYRDVIQHMLPTCEIHYLGCDIYKNSNLRLKDEEFISFKDNKDLFKKIKTLGFSPDLIFSQSVFEHIKDDGVVFHELASEFPRSSMLHVVPGGASGLQYISHGFRRYTLNNINNKFVRILRSRVHLYPIGGRECFSLFPDYELQFRGVEHRFSFILKSMSDKLSWNERDRVLIDSLMYFKGKQRPTFWGLFSDPSDVLDS